MYLNDLNDDATTKKHFPFLLKALFCEKKLKKQIEKTFFRMFVHLQKFLRLLKMIHCCLECTKPTSKLVGGIEIE